MNIQPPRNTYKAFLWDYDSLLSYSDEECCYSLSEREIQILLAQIDPIAWKTRYKPTETEIDVNLLQRWQGNLARKLMSGCCPDDDKIFRYDDDGNLESSTDGGLTWTDDPSADPRLTAPQFPPLPGANGSTKKCVAANNAAGQIRIMADQLIADSAAWGALTGLIGVILGILVFLSIFGTGGVLTPIVVTLAGALLSAGSAAFEAAMTVPVWESLVCVLYCNMQEDGSFTEQNIKDIHDEIQIQFTGIAQEYLEETINLIGAVGLTNMGRTSGGLMDVDCATCECEPPCFNPDNFSAGEVVSSEENEDGSWTFVVNSVDNGAGTHYIRWGTTGVPACCCVTEWEVEVAAVPEWYYWACDNQTETPTFIGGFVASEVSVLQQINNAALGTPFTATVTIAGECP